MFESRNSTYLGLHDQWRIVIRAENNAEGIERYAEARMNGIEILQAAQLKSPAFTKYRDREAVDMQALVEAHMAESENEDDAALLVNILGPAMFFKLV